VFRKVTGELARSLPQAERVMIPGASHDLGDPATFTEPVLDFLAKHG
jgi:hypothetical protein